MSVRDYIQLIKPGIIMGNLITLSGGFLLAAQGQVDPRLIFFTLFGTALVIASGAVCNNVIDIDIDAIMHRTQRRALVLGLIAPKTALLYSAALGFGGLALLGYHGNTLIMLMALGGWFIYVCLYSGYFKRHSIHGVLVGSLSGAVPPMIGYCAVSNRLDGAALSLGLILCLWQIPHAYAIALRRLDDYRAARLQLLPLVKGVQCTQLHMQRYILAFTIATTTLWWQNHTGGYYAAIMFMMGGLWWWAARQKGHTQNPKHLSRWGLTQFTYSIVSIMLFSLMLGLDYVTPSPIGTH